VKPLRLYTLSSAMLYPYSWLDVISFLFLCDVHYSRLDTECQ